MANNIRFSASLDDKVSGPMDRIRGKMDALGGRGTAASLFGNIGAKVAAGAVGLVADAASQLIGKLGDAQAAFREDEASQSRLRASLAANVPAYKGNTDAIEKVIASRMKLGFSDDEQRASLAQLVTRTKDSAKALEIQSTAMDLARLKGISLETATNLLGKAYSGNVGALTRAGIAVDKNATATEALAAVQKAAKGQAEAFASTSAGRVAASQIKVGESMERVGLVIARVSDVAIPILADAFETVVNVVGDVVAAVQKFIGENKGLFDILGGIAGLIGNVLVTGLRTLADVTGTAFGIVSTVIGGVFDVVKGVVSGIIGTIRNVMAVAAELPGPWQEGAKAIKATLDGMQTSVESWGKSTTATAGSTAFDVVAKTSAGLAGGASAVGDAAEEMAEPIPDEVETAGRKALRAVDRSIAGMVSRLSASRGAFEAAAAGVASATWDPAINRAELALTQLALKDADLLANLKSKDASIRLAAQVEYANLQKDLATQRAAVQTDQAQGKAELDAALAARSQTIRNVAAIIGGDARTAAASIDTVLKKIPESAYGYGYAALNQLAQGMKDRQVAVATQARIAAQTLADYLQLRSPAKKGPLSQGGPEVWGAKVATLFGDGMAGAVSAVSGASSRLADAASFSGSFGGFTAAAPVRSGGGGAAPNINVTYSPMISLGSPAEMQNAAAMLIPSLTREMRRQGLL